MKDKPKTEEELAAQVVTWLQDQGWETFHEVQVATYGKRADIVARAGAVLWVVETKMSLSFEVIEQAWRWHFEAPLVSVAVPAANRSAMAARFCEYMGVGMITVDKYQDIRVEVAPRMHRVNGKIVPPWGRLAQSLHDGHKESAPGNARAEFFTPYRNTVQELKRVVDAEPGILMADAVKKIGHHYSSDKSAVAALAQWLRKGMIAGITTDIIKNRIRLFPAGAARAAQLGLDGAAGV